MLLVKNLEKTVNHEKGIVDFLIIDVVTYCASRLGFERIVDCCENDL